MKVAQTYVRGGKHIAMGIECEDRTYSLCKNGVQVIALADGAGNAKYTHSAEGAECVTETVSLFFCNNFDKFYFEEDEETLRKVLITALKKSLTEYADQHGIDSIIRLSSTLLCVAVKDDMAIICHLGDGVVGRVTMEGAEAVSVPDNGEFANVTYFVPTPNAYEKIRILRERTSGTISYFLMSDGTQEYIFDDAAGKFREAALKMANMVFDENGSEELQRTIEKYIVSKDSSSDDCSFICLSMENLLPKCFATTKPATEPAAKPVTKPVTKPLEESVIKSVAEISGGKSLLREESHSKKNVEKKPFKGISLVGVAIINMLAIIIVMFVILLIVNPGSNKTDSGDRKSGGTRFYSVDVDDYEEVVSLFRQKYSKVFDTCSNIRIYRNSNSTAYVFEFQKPGEKYSNRIVITDRVLESWMN